MDRAGNHTSEQKGLLRTWPQEGPKVLWTVPMGAGFGGPAVSGGKVYLLDRDEKVGDTLRVLDLASGKELWTFAYDASGQLHVRGLTDDADRRRRARLHRRTDGGPARHQHEDAQAGLAQEHLEGLRRRGELPRWAIVQNPLIYGDLLIVAPQTSQAGVVAYDKLTGELKWKSAALSGMPGYVTPVHRQDRRARTISS